MERFIRRCLLVLFILSGTFLSGCSERVPRGVLFGVVTLDGSPVADAHVRLVADENAVPTEIRATRTDARGHYELINLEPGTYRVVIRKMAKTNGAPLDPEMDLNQIEAMLEWQRQGQFRSVVPVAYTDPRHTTLRVEVSRAKQRRDFALTTRL